MKKVVLCICIVFFIQGCKEKKLPEQGHNGPNIDVEKNYKNLSVDALPESDEQK